MVSQEVQEAITSGFKKAAAELNTARNAADELIEALEYLQDEIQKKGGKLAIFSHLTLSSGEVVIDIPSTGQKISVDTLGCMRFDSEKTKIRTSDIALIIEEVAKSADFNRESSAMVKKYGTKPETSPLHHR